MLCSSGAIEGLVAIVCAWVCTGALTRACCLMARRPLDQERSCHVLSHPGFEVGIIPNGHHLMHIERSRMPFFIDSSFVASPLASASMRSVDMLFCCFACRTRHPKRLS